jgi:hypothetical protein
LVEDCVDAAATAAMRSGVERKRIKQQDFCFIKNALPRQILLLLQRGPADDGDGDGDADADGDGDADADVRHRRSDLSTSRCRLLLLMRGMMPHKVALIMTAALRVCVVCIIMSVATSMAALPIMLPPNALAVDTGPPFAVGAHGQVVRKCRDGSMGARSFDIPLAASPGSLKRSPCGHQTA